jgi:hypothetical protein
MIERTPTEFRDAYDQWKKTAPSNDSDILPDKPRSATAQKRADKLSFLRAILAWREMRESRDPLQTNFLQSGTDDEIANDDGTFTIPKRDIECVWEDRPTIKEMISPLGDVDFKKSYDNVISYNGHGFTFKYLRERLIPDQESSKNKELIECRVDGKKVKKPRVGYGEEYRSRVFNEKGEQLEADDKGLLMKSVVRLGFLEFSDAISNEIHPRGSLMKWHPGPWGEIRNGPGTPNGLSENFFPPPEIRRLNPLERLIAIEDAIAANDNLAPDHAKTLDTVMTAGNFREVGEQFGFKGKTAERHGKRLVLEASKELSEVLERLAA